MKILWLTNVVVPEHARMLNLPSQPRGGWIPSLADSLLSNTEVELAIATNINVNEFSCHTGDRIKYWTIPCPKGFNLNPETIGYYQQIEREFQPDLIKIHGTEYGHGLLTARKHLKSPALISIQGILDVYHHHYFGDLSLKDVFSSRTLRDWVRLDGLYEQKYKMKKRAKVEQVIFSAHTSFCGRTLWDYSHTKRLNPDADYYHCNDVLRPAFYHTTWQKDESEPYTIFTSSASYPLKGFDLVLKAVRLLRKEFPKIRIITTLSQTFEKEKGLSFFWKTLRSTGYAKHLTSFIKKHDLADHIISHESLDEKQMARCYKNAHAFVLPSFIENSPNSLAEAQIIGTPAIAADIGGVSSMACNEENVLLFPSGEYTVLAQQIRRIFADRQLAEKLSKNSRKLALARHDSKSIARDMITIYKKVIQAHH